MKYKIFIISAIFFTALTSAQSPNLGTSGAQFLEIPVGARATSLGGAFVGLSDDITGVFWNPAGIAKIKSGAAHFSYMRWFDMFDYSATALGYNLEGIGVFSLSLILFSMDRMEITTEEQPNGTGRFFDANDIAFGLTYSRFLTDRFSVGLTLKYVRQSIWNETADGIAFDIGTQYRLDFQNLTIAMKMSNFGPDLRYDGDDLNVVYDKRENLPKNRLTPAKLVTNDYPLPLTFQVGVAMDVYTSEFFSAQIAIDAVHPNDNQERINAGTELNFFDRIFLRGGYRYNYDDEDINFGAGVNLPLGTTLINFDYSYSMYNILPGVHRISLGMEF